jgi:hypothetical protein
LSIGPTEVLVSRRSSSISQIVRPLGVVICRRSTHQPLPQVRVAARHGAPEVAVTDIDGQA